MVALHGERWFSCTQNEKFSYKLPFRPVTLQIHTPVGCDRLPSSVATTTALDAVSALTGAVPSPALLWEIRENPSEHARMLPLDHTYFHKDEKEKIYSGGDKFRLAALRRLRGFHIYKYWIQEHLMISLTSQFFNYLQVIWLMKALMIASNSGSQFLTYAGIRTAVSSQ